MQEILYEYLALSLQHPRGRFDGQILLRSKLAGFGCVGSLWSLGGVNWVWSLLLTIYLIEFISHPARVWLGDLDFRTYRRGH